MFSTAVFYLIPCLFSLCTSVPIFQIPVFVIGGSKYEGGTTEMAIPLVSRLTDLHFSKIYLIPFYPLNFSKTELYSRLEAILDVDLQNDSLLNVYADIVQNPKSSSHIKKMAIITMSHLIATRAIIAHNMSEALVFEDDARLHSLFYSHLDFLWRNRNGPRADGYMYQLGVQVPRKGNVLCSDPASPNDLGWTKGSEFSTAGYILSNEGALYVSHSISQLNIERQVIPVDVLFKDILSKKSYHVRISPENNDHNTMESYKHLQHWRYVVWECGIVTQRPMQSRREENIYDAWRFF